MISVDELLMDCQRHHSTLQLDSFITVRSGMTLYGCYRQSLRELDTREPVLDEMKWKLEKLRRKIEKWKVNGKAEKAAHKEKTISRLEREIAETQDEFDRFYAQAIATRQVLESQGVKFPLDRETKDRLDRDMWLVILKANAAVEILTNPHRLLGKSTVELFRSLPKSMKDELAMVLDSKNHKELCAWFLNYETPMPEIQRLQCSRSPDLPRLSGNMSQTDSPPCLSLSWSTASKSAKAAKIDVESHAAMPIAAAGSG